MGDRAACIVPGCRNSSAKFAGMEYICGPHWRAIPRWIKRRDRRLRRILIARGWAREDDRAIWALRDRAARLIDQSWDQLRRAAIKAASGL